MPRVDAALPCCGCCPKGCECCCHPSQVLLTQAKPLLLLWSLLAFSPFQLSPFFCFYRGGKLVLDAAAAVLQRNTHTKYDLDNSRFFSSQCHCYSAKLPHAPCLLYVFLVVSLPVRYRLLEPTLWVSCSVFYCLPVILLYHTPPKVKPQLTITSFCIHGTWPSSGIPSYLDTSFIILWHARAHAGLHVKCLLLLPLFFFLCV